MTQQFDPFTVSAIVDVITGALVTRPTVQPGFVDYVADGTPPALDPSHQFRWVHVSAISPASAARTDALVADLIPGPGRRPPVARALTGIAGLKPYTVAVAVHSRTRHRVGNAVAMDGHVPTTIPTPRGTRQHTVHLWASDRQAAIAQVLGTGPAYTPQEIAHDVARQRWQQMADRPTAERIIAVTDAVWRSGYAPVYRTAFAYAAATIAAAATAAARDNPAAWASLQQLAAAAGAAVNRVPHIPSADQATLDAAVHAVATPDDRQPPWQQIADATLDNIKRGALPLAAAAAADGALTGWHARGGHVLANQVSVNGQPAATWVADLMARVTDKPTDVPGRPHGRAAAGRTAAQLARQDQTPGARPVAPRVPADSRRPPDAPSTSAAAPRRGR